MRERPTRARRDKHGRSKAWLAWVALLLPLLTAARVYHSEAEALAIVFPQADRMVAQPYALNDAQRAVATRIAHVPVRDHAVVFHQAYRGATRLGSAVILQEKGKTLPFRFLVAFFPDGRVDQVLLLTYREPRGDEIARQGFRRQYRGKTLDDPIRRGRDIRNVTGATISVDALSRGVRRALALYQGAAQGARLRAHAAPPPRFQ